MLILQENSINKPAIVIVAHKRDKSLKRLLSSIAQANYEQYNDIDLIISIDRSDSPNVAQVAHDFIWKFGTKQVIVHKNSLGLRGNILFCGDLTYYYDSVIILEDDLLVSPLFYKYSVEALKFYQNCDHISGISLYSYHYNEYAKIRFIPLDDGYDNYFIQSATSWGQAWTKPQWDNFRNWYKSYGNIPINKDDIVPETIINRWSAQSWKKYFIKYMILEDKYFVVPRFSLTTNFGNLGNHVLINTNNLQVPLLMQKNQQEWNFCYLENSGAVYDAHYEIRPYCLYSYNPSLAKLEWECDLYGTKNYHKITKEYVLTIRHSIEPINSYSLGLIPQELNIALKLQGDFFCLTKKEDCKTIKYRKKLAQYICLNQDAGIKRFAALAIDTTLKRLSI